MTFQLFTFDKSGLFIYAYLHTKNMCIHVCMYICIHGVTVDVHTVWSLLIQHYKRSAIFIVYQAVKIHLAAHVWITVSKFTEMVITPWTHSPDYRLPTFGIPIGMD